MVISNSQLDLEIFLRSPDCKGLVAGEKVELKSNKMEVLLIPRTGLQELGDTSIFALGYTSVYLKSIF